MVLNIFTYVQITIQNDKNENSFDKLKYFIGMKRVRLKPQNLDVLNVNIPSDVDKFGCFLQDDLALHGQFPGRSDDQHHRALLLPFFNLIQFQIDKCIYYTIVVVVF